MRRTVLALVDHGLDEMGLGAAGKVLEEGGVQADDDAVDARQSDVP